ncbi:HindIII family type II restriction endonuclease, partial [Azospirillum argentinense]
INDIWMEEKIASVESIALAKEEALTFLAKEREKIMRMSHEEALIELVKINKIESRMNVIRSLNGNNILGIR